MGGLKRGAEDGLTDVWAEMLLWLLEQKRILGFSALLGLLGL